MPFPRKDFADSIDFSDSGERPYTREELHESYSRRSAEILWEQSYGRLRLTGDTTDWVTLPQQSPAVGSCGALTNELLGTIASERKLDLATYAGVLALVNAPVGDCADVGQAARTVGGREYRIAVGQVPVSRNSSPFGYYSQPFQWSKLDFAVSHELGHLIGADHAGGLECGAKQAEPPCTLREYGNFFDVMGAGKYSLHFNAFTKERLGWLLPEEVLTITESGQYTLNAFELIGGTKIAKITPPGAPSGEYIYAEYRTPAGFDAGLGSKHRCADSCE